MPRRNSHHRKKHEVHQDHVEEQLDAHVNREKAYCRDRHLVGKDNRDPAGRRWGTTSERHVTEREQGNPAYCLESHKKAYSHKAQRKRAEFKSSKYCVVTIVLF